METAPKKPSNGDLLMQIVTDIAEVKSDLKTVIMANRDHEHRLRELEKARWSSAWLVGLLSAIVTSGVVAIIVRMVTK